MENIELKGVAGKIDEIKTGVCSNTCPVNYKPEKEKNNFGAVFACQDAQQCVYIDTTGKIEYDNKQ